MSFKEYIDSYLSCNPIILLCNNVKIRVDSDKKNNDRFLLAIPMKSIDGSYIVYDNIRYDYIDFLVRKCGGIDLEETIKINS